MKAFTIKQYGPPEEVLVRKDLEKPIPTDREIRVHVKTTTINDYDWCLTTGKPLAYRLYFGMLKPRKKLHVPGMELSGIVDAVGPGATLFTPGDAVYGDTSEYGFGTFGEFVCLDERAFTRKPDEMSFEEAATIPHASQLALQAINFANIAGPGRKILINGGGGGVGAFGVQLVKLHGAEVTGVDTGEKLARMEQQGFDHIVDYKQADFTDLGKKYDLIIDCKTNRSPFAYMRALKPDGKYVTVGGRSGNLIQMLLLKPFIHFFSRKRFHLVALDANRDLGYINKLYASGKISCQIDGPYPFEKIPWAVRRFGEGRHHGKIVITMGG